MENMKLVPYVVNKKFRDAAFALGFEDLVSVGYIGLIKAVRDFDESRGLKFSTVAVKYIATEVYKYVRENRSMLHLPVHFVERLSQDELEQYYVSSYDGFGLDSLEMCRALADDRVDIERHVVAKLDYERALSSMSDNQKRVIAVWRKHGKMREAAKELGISPARVQQVVSKFEEKLRTGILEKKHGRRKKNA